MCWVSRALAPRLPWLESGLGEWYWNQPAKRMVMTSVTSDDPKLLGEHLLSSLDAICEPSAGETLVEEEEGKNDAPHRAPPRDRCLSSGSQAPIPPACTNFIL